MLEFINLGGRGFRGAERRSCKKWGSPMTVLSFIMEIAIHGKTVFVFDGALISAIIIIAFWMKVVRLLGKHQSC